MELGCMPLFPDLAFGLPFYVKGSKLFMKCVVNNATNATDWMYQLPDQSLATKFPDCNYLCDKDPYDDPKKVVNRTWVAGVLTVGTKANYFCPRKYLPTFTRLDVWLTHPI